MDYMTKNLFLVFHKFVSASGFLKNLKGTNNLLLRAHLSWLVFWCFVWIIFCFFMENLSLFELFPLYSLFVHLFLG